MWQTKYAATIPKNLGVGVNFRPCSEGYFLSGRPQSVALPHLLHKYLVYVINSNLVITSQNFHLLHFFSAILCKEINFLIVSNEHSVQKTITSDSNREFFNILTRIGLKLGSLIITEVDILPNTGDFAMHFRICSLTLILKLGLVASFGGYSSYSMV